MRKQFRRIDIPSRFSPRVGSQELLLAENGLDVGSTYGTVVDLLERAR